MQTDRHESSFSPTAKQTVRRRCPPLDGLVRWGVPIDYRVYERARAGDAAVRSLSLPETVSPREPFQFTVELFADRDVEGTLIVLRDGQPIARREGPFLTGTNRLTFRDLIESGGIHNYSAQLDVEEDPLPENNTGAGLVRVDAGPRLLVLSSDGAESNLVGALRSARLPVDVAIAGQHELTQDALDPYRAVIIENAPAKEFGRLKMETLAQFVEDLGGGLMLTGGQRSFGVGGYFNSPLDDVLPVSMEIREEHRKTRVAIAIALDRSGSMAVSVAGGKTKMDLANLGTAECVRLLSPGDSVAVIAVDSSPHVIQSLVDVAEPEAIARKALKIESMGGGIFVYEALVAAGKELMKAEQATKHIILFSDAADSEEPGNYKSLLKKYESSGITVSVIGLGSKADADAKLLEDIAKLGSGNIMFIRCHTPDMVRKEIWAHLLAYNLIRTVIAQATLTAGKHPRQISFTRAMRTLEAFRATLAHTPAKQLATLYQQMLTVIATHEIANRPDRLEPRQRKRRPKPYPLMTMPRNKARKHYGKTR